MDNITTITNFLSSPGSPFTFLRSLSAPPLTPLPASLPASPLTLFPASPVLSPDRQLSSYSNQNYVDSASGENICFTKIIGIKVTHDGSFYMSLEYPDTPENFDRILSPQPVPVEKLRHNEEATAWTKRFEKWVEQIRHNIPFDTFLDWDDMKSIYTADARLISWLQSRGLSNLQPQLEKHGCVSIDLLSYLDKETMLLGGMGTIAAEVLDDEIRSFFGRYATSS